MHDERPEQLEERVLLLAPTARDAAISRGLLEVAGIRCCGCSTMEDVCREARRGAGAAIVTAEAVLGDKRGQLASWLEAQPPWSDFPLVVLTPSGAESPKLLGALEAVGNMTLLKRPVQVSALVSTVRSALRDRRRQYAVRDLLAERQQTAETLRVERERYRVTLSSIGDAVVSTDAGGRVTFLNSVAEVLSGWTQAEAIGHPLPEVFQIVNERTRRPVENPALRALREGVVVGLANHTVLVARDGAERPIDDSAAPMRTESGMMLGAVLVFRDVTDRKRAEEAQARLAAIVESSEDAIISKTLDGTILSWNTGAGQLFGYSPDEAVGQPITLIIPPDRQEEERKILDRLRRGERIDHFETVRRAKDGRRLDISLTVSPVRNAEGRVVGASKVARDVTARKLAERALQESEARYRAIVEATPECVKLVGPDGTLLHMNPAGLAMVEAAGAEAVLGRCIYNVIAPERRDVFRAFNERVCQGERGTLEFDIIGLQGTRRHMETTAVPLPTPDGGFTHLAVTRDVTRRKEMEDALRQADRKKDDFIALLAHELRNPLAPLRNGLQVMRLAGGDSNGAVVQARSMMERQLAHMVRLIDDLMDVSRIGRNKMELRQSRVSLADVVSAAVETARPAINSEEHELTVSLPHQPVFFNADLTRLAQVLSNLLTNSAKYTERGGRIWLFAERRGQEVVISVRDTGIGIPAESLGDIFDMFSQVDRSIERSTGGLGIGLALVKGLVEMHGGTVTAESEGQGLGSTFTVTLPVLPNQPESAAVVSASEGAAPGPRRRILVVDDNRDGADSLAMMLRLMNNEVRTAYHGLDALEQAEAFRPEIVLMDIGMPHLNGLDATRRIREREWGREVTIVALTGWGQESDRVRSREAGCDGHLVKPVHLPDLERMLGELQRKQPAS